MGIRFYCPNGHKLNVKSHLAGKRGFCPDCGTSVTIPFQSTRPSRRETNERMRQTIPNGQAGKVPDSQNSAIFQLKDATPLENAQVIIRAALENPNAVWYVQVADGQRFGPAPTHMIKEWIEQKRISPTMPVWCEGMPEWLPAANVFPELPPMFEPSEAMSHNMPKTVPAPKPAALESDEGGDDSDIEQNGIRMTGGKKTKFLIIAVMIAVLAALAFLLYWMFTGHGGVR